MREFKLIDNVQYMKCSKCKEWFPESTEYFPRNKSCKNGLWSYCRQCHSKKSRKWAKKHPKQHNKCNKEWRKKNPIRYKIFCAKSVGKRRNLGFNLIAPIPFDKEDASQWAFHHINNNNVVAVPRDLHDLYSNKEHKFMLLQIIKQIYPNISIKETWT